MKFLAIMQDGKLVLPEAQRQLRQHFVATLRDGQRVEETLVKKSDSGTHEQLKYQFGVIIALLIDYCIEWGHGIFGCAPTRDMVKEVLYVACADSDDDGCRLTLSKMDKAQRSAFIDRCMHWCAHLTPPLFIPPADPNWQEKRKSNGHTETEGD